MILPCTSCFSKPPVSDTGRPDLIFQNSLLPSNSTSFFFQSFLFLQRDNTVTLKTCSNAGIPCYSKDRNVSYTDRKTTKVQEIKRNPEPGAIKEQPLTSKKAEVGTRSFWSIREKTLTALALIQMLHSKSCTQWHPLRL